MTFVLSPEMFMTTGWCETSIWKACVCSGQTFIELSNLCLPSRGHDLRGEATLIWDNDGCRAQVTVGGLVLLHHSHCSEVKLVLHILLSLISF